VTSSASKETILFSSKIPPTDRFGTTAGCPDRVSFMANDVQCKVFRDLIFEKFLDKLNIYRFIQQTYDLFDYDGTLIDERFGEYFIDCSILNMPSFITSGGGFKLGPKHAWTRPVQNLLKIGPAVLAWFVFLSNGFILQSTDIKCSDGSGSKIFDSGRVNFLWLGSGRIGSAIYGLG